MGRLDGKVAIVSGASRGMGAAEAKQFVAEGGQVVMGDVLDAEGQALAVALGGASVYQHLDVTNAASWREAVEVAMSHFGKLDVLVNNAGIFRTAPIESLGEDLWESVIAINQTGVFLGMKCAIPAMKKSGGGSIINISSIDGLIGSTESLAYVASKFRSERHDQGRGTRIWGSLGLRRIRCIREGSVHRWSLKRYRPRR